MNNGVIYLIIFSDIFIFSKFQLLLKGFHNCLKVFLVLVLAYKKVLRQYSILFYIVSVIVVS